MWPKKVRGFASCKHLLLKKIVEIPVLHSLSSIPYSVIRIDYWDWTASVQFFLSSLSILCGFPIFCSGSLTPWHVASGIHILDKTLRRYTGIPHTQTSPMALPKTKRIIKSVCVSFHFPLQREEKYGQKAWPLVIALQDYLQLNLRFSHGLLPRFGHFSY